MFSSMIASGGSSPRTPPVQIPRSTRLPAKPPAQAQTSHPLNGHLHGLSGSGNGCATHFEASSAQAMLRYLEDASQSLRSQLELVRGCIKWHPSSTSFADLADAEVQKLDAAIIDFRAALVSTPSGGGVADQRQGSHRLGHQDVSIVVEEPSASRARMRTVQCCAGGSSSPVRETKESELLVDLDEVPVQAPTTTFQLVAMPFKDFHMQEANSNPRRDSRASSLLSMSEKGQETDSVSVQLTKEVSNRASRGTGQILREESVNDVCAWVEEPTSSGDRKITPAAESRLSGISPAPSLQMKIHTDRSYRPQGQRASLPRVEDCVRSSCVQSLRLELNRPDDKESRCPSGVINPRWMCKMGWDMGIILLVLLDALILPFQFAYKSTDSDDSFDTAWLWITTLFFAIDIGINFMTAYEAGSKDKDVDPGSLITSKPAIAWHYLRSWFPIDLVSTIPWGLLASAMSGGEGGDGGASLAKLTKAVKFVRFLRLMRMLRLAKLGGLWERIEVHMGSMALLQSVALLRVMFGLMAICHWNACIWWMIGQEESILTEMWSAEAQRDWRSIPHWTTVIRSGMGRDEEWTWMQLGMTDAYIFCFYWTLGVMRTMPSEVTPVNKAERVYVMIFMFFAFSAFAISVAMITQTFFKISERKRTFSEEMAAIRMYLRRIKASETQQVKVKAYLRHLFEKRDILAKEDNLLRRLPDDINQRLKREKLVRILPRIRLLAKAEKIVLYHIAAIVQAKDALPGETIVFKGTRAEGAWICMLGHMRAMPIKDVTDVVDEECLETADDVMSSHTVSAVTCCELYKVPKNEFVELMKEDVLVRDDLGSHNSTLYQQILEGMEVASPYKAPFASPPMPSIGRCVSPFSEFDQQGELYSPPSVRDRPDSGERTLFRQSTAGKHLPHMAAVMAAG